MAGDSTVIDLNEPKDEANAARNEFYFVNKDGEEIERDVRDDSLADARICESLARINNEQAKIERWGAMQAKINAQKAAVKAEHFEVALSLKNEIKELKEKLHQEDLEWVMKKQMEKEELEAHKAYQLGKKMARQTMLKFTKEEHGGNDFFVLVKHNGQVQWEVFSRRNASWSNGDLRSQKDIDEFSIGTKTSTGSASLWHDFTDANNEKAPEEK